MNKSFLFFDVDGTLIDINTGLVPESAIEAVKKARKSGHKIYINSGRVRCMLDDISEFLEVDGIICGCGTQIIEDGKIIYERKLSSSDCRKVMDLCIKHRVEPILEAKERVYIRDIPIVDCEKLRSLYSYIESVCELKKINLKEDVLFEKFCMMSSNAGEEKRVFEFLNDLNKAELDEDYEFIDKEDGFYEFVPILHSKGKAVDYLLDKYNVSPKDVYVFGDGNNDIPMFSCKAENKIIMGKHDAPLLKYASFVTKNVEEDGISYAMHKYGII